MSNRAVSFRAKNDTKLNHSRPTLKSQGGLPGFSASHRDIAADVGAHECASP